MNYEQLTKLDNVNLRDWFRGLTIIGMASTGLSPQIIAMRADAIADEMMIKENKK